MADDDPSRSSPARSGRAHELSRRRRTRAAVEETGRQHHLGGPPPAAPVHEGDEAGWTQASGFRLRQLTARQLDDLGGDLRRRMTEASEGLAFEEAASLRDQLDAVAAERERRRVA